MLEVIDFDLDNCYVITYDGRLLKQARGIPMGSALSPPLAIGTLARGWSKNGCIRLKMMSKPDSV